MNFHDVSWQPVRGINGINSLTSLPDLPGGWIVVRASEKVGAMQKAAGALTAELQLESPSMLSLSCECFYAV